ncbi:MAG: aldehyde:ferredoxin oxidoreductase, partial [Porticoccaceae bacterium]
MISDTDGNGAAKKPQDFKIRSFKIDLTAQAVTPETVQCEDLEDALGGIARGFKLLENCPTDAPYDPSATLILNLGILSGTDFMTGLRTYFHGYSPLKSSLSGRPSAMWSAGSGKFGTKLRHLDVDEVVFTGRCEKPTLLRIHRDTEDGPVEFSFEDATDLVGMQVNPKILKLHEKYPNAHFAVIGPSGENYENCRYAAIALSTENQLKSKDNKPRFCGRGGMGGVMGSKNLIAIVVDTKDRIGPKAPPELKELNQEVAKGKGSAKFRDKDKFGGGGGTWANYDALNPVHAMPEMNFVPTGTKV